MNGPVLDAKNVTIDYRLGDTWLNAVCDVSLTIQPLHIHGLVGESGSGKSTLGLGIMNYLAANARISEGEILFQGEDIAKKNIAEMRKIWGRDMSLVPQDPLSSLNPSFTIGNQMAELTQLHLGLSHRDAVKHAIDMLNRVKLADPEAVILRYPHQLSGGMQQRVMIAMALSTQPRLLVLDEPTTALDVTTQAVILDLFRDLILNENAASLYVSHDLGTVAQLCDDVTVLYGGEVMESAPVIELFSKPLHPYTYGLLSSLPAHSLETETRLPTIKGVAPSLSERPHACVFAPRCPVAIDKCHETKPALETTPDGRLIRCHRWQEIANGELVLTTKEQPAVAVPSARKGHVMTATAINKKFGEQTLLGRITRQDPDYVHAVDDASISVKAQSTLGLVGESGSGKTTLARAIVALTEADSGEIELCDVVIPNSLGQRTTETLRDLQMVFQNPNDTLNPYHTVGQALTRTIQRLTDDVIGKEEMRQRVLDLLKSVRLTPEYYHRLPNELSGGEKQRVAIARAFATNPALVVADEPTSSLDVSVQAVILNLLKDMRATKGASYLFISHDLDVIAYLADWIAVMYLGQIVEEGTTDQVNKAPSHPYTEALISAIPIPDPTKKASRIRLEGDIPSARNIPSGCRFHTRCPRKIGAICETDEPPWRNAGDNHYIRCHIEIDDLIDMQATPPENGA